MTAADSQGRNSRQERLARAAVGMPTEHPELVTRKPARAEWKLLVAWCAELWPHDEYAAIVAEEWRQDWPPGAQGWS
jgi:hypothetical protein